MLLDGPLWLVKLVPTQDGPVHLAQADLIARFGWGGALQEPAASFYQWNPRIEPNSAIYLLLAGLIRLTGDALMANTLFLSLYGLIWIAAAFVVCRSETERPMLPILLLLPLAFGVFIHWGFYNYALGVPLFLLFAGFWRKARERRNAATFITTALFLSALCLTHLTAVVAACLLLAADGLARAIRTLDRSGIRAAASAQLTDRWRLGSRSSASGAADHRQLFHGVSKYSWRSCWHRWRSDADPAPDHGGDVPVQLYLVGNRCQSRRCWLRCCRRRRGVAPDRIPAT